MNLMKTLRWETSSTTCHSDHMKTKDGREIVYKRGRWVLVNKKSPTKQRRAFIMDTSFIEDVIAFWKENGAVYLPYEVCSSKNSQQIIMVKGEYKLVKSRAYNRYEQITAPYYKKQRQLFLRFTREMMLPINIWMYHIRSTKGKFDYHNMTQGPADLMQKHEWIADDDMAHVKFHPGDYVTEKNYQGLVLSFREMSFSEKIYKMKSQVRVPSNHE